MRSSGAQEVSAVFRPALTISNGGASSPIRGRRRGCRNRTAAELWIDREIRNDFIALEDRAGNVPSEAIQRIRLGVQRPAGCLARRIVEAHAAGCDHQKVRRIALRMVELVDKLYARNVETVRENIVLWQSARVA